MPRTADDQLVIEHPSVSAGGEYRDDYTVYRYGAYPDSSVLAGQQKRSWVDSFDTLAEARAAYPAAEWNDGGSPAVPVHIPETAPSWFDEANAGEHWSETDAY